ncbi:molybdopterin-binding protein [Salsipaludibacter albus]|uniref:competence/damage-inducible protein A n=1 Tax=Salsipaludibacter albus TaxID=2849650 RepID=UPI001EE44B7B|nr:competence/damage-inducible protein A [Salsipaludibacter albus]
MGTVQASLVVIGDEILDGHVADANTGVLARALARHGVALQRTHTVGDDPDAIAEAVHAELARSRPRLLVTSGGIGSTPDDITFTAVAAALDRPVERNDVVAARLEASLDRQRDLGIPIGPDVVEPMMRMADLPVGARLLADVSGWVPAVVVDLDGGVAADGVTVAILPGVPGAFAHIVDEGLVPIVAGRNPVPEVVEVTHGLPESLLNPVFAVVGRDFPDVKLGSYPGRPMLVRLTGPGDRARAAADRVATHLEDLLATDGGRRLARQWGGREDVATRSSDQAMAARTDDDPEEEDL